MDIIDIQRSMETCKISPLPLPQEHGNLQRPIVHEALNISPDDHNTSSPRIFVAKSMLRESILPVIEPGDGYVPKLRRTRSAILEGHGTPRAPRCDPDVEVMENEKEKRRATK
eukprot:gnl/TRDRNA2_/TRDRNA2_173309_c0_seq1.p2 gnl/TRDRNA2_/TRDRNA2_173309_c0~~gnl/TRDRNA2_/TRDRNA2_173309_c0_seq1.p2  ORF type:complete len:113 (+),score=14.85 gnl/TRDRNA2_/TRDRNA2_173309_c0_seq1:78-416(+)